MCLNIYLNHLHPHLNGKVHLFVKIIFYNKTLFQLKQVRSFYLKFSCGKLRTLTGFDINNKKDSRKKMLQLQVTAFSISNKNISLFIDIVAHYGKAWVESQNLSKPFTIIMQDFPFHEHPIHDLIICVVCTKMIMIFGGAKDIFVFRFYREIETSYLADLCASWPSNDK